MKLPADCLRRSAGFAFLLAVFRQVLGKGCPPDATERAMLCVSSFGGSAQDTNMNNRFLTDWDFIKIRQACSNETFARGIKCAETIIKSCDDQVEQRNYLKKFVNIPRLKEGVNQICTHTVTELADDADCIRKQRPFVKQCAEAEVAEFRLKVQKLGEDMDRILEAACQVLQQVVKCQVGSVRRNCGGRPADELTKVLPYFDPPYCASSLVDDVGNVGDSLTGRALLTLTLCLMSTVYLWLS